MATVNYTLSPDTRISAEQIKELENAEKLAAVYDSDSPQLTQEQYKEFETIANRQREERKKKVVSLRLKATTLEKAKMLGKGYTGILSRMLDFCIDNSEIVKKCL